MKIDQQVALAPRTTLGVGGNAAHYARVENAAELREALAWASGQREEVRVLGGGSNIVVADAGYQGLVLEMAMLGTHVATESEGAVHVRVAAGEAWDGFVSAMVARGYQGLECLSGIPGRVGATPIQNVGAYGQDVSETISSVLTFDRRALTERRFSGAECQFAYRDSFFKSAEPDRFIVTEVSFKLRPGAPAALRYAELERHFAQQGAATPSLSEVREAVLALRAAKSMLLDVNDANSRSCGSFFVNPVLNAAQMAAFLTRASAEGDIPRFPQTDGQVKLSAGWLIEHAGLQRGMRDGSVGLSTKHALALVAHEGATAADIARLAARVQDAVSQRFGVNLQREPVFWGFSPAQPTLA